jgi:uncharacterized protein DUF6600
MDRNVSVMLTIALGFVLLIGSAVRNDAAVNVTVGVNTGDFGFLGTYGTWVDVPEHGRVWRPRVVSGWSPYSRGEWIWTDQGWTWISDEPYGWAVYHYGDWTYTSNYGWVWIPGYNWSPARVQWMYYGDFAGWAPLGVRVQDPWIDARFWHVVRFRDLDRHDVHLYLVRRPLAPARTIRVIRNAPDVREFERFTNRKVVVTRFNTIDVRGGSHVFKKIEIQRAAGPNGAANMGAAGQGGALSPDAVEKEKIKVKKTKHHKHKVKPHN